jgi:hypothetical protein
MLWWDVGCGVVVIVFVFTQEGIFHRLHAKLMMMPCLVVLLQISKGLLALTHHVAVHVRQA